MKTEVYGLTPLQEELMKENVNHLFDFYYIVLPDLLEEKYRLGNIQVNLEALAEEVAYPRSYFVKRYQEENLSLQDLLFLSVVLECSLTVKLKKGTENKSGENSEREETE